MADIIPFVPRNAVTRRPMLEQMAHEVIQQITVPTCHDDLTGNSVLEYESSLGYTSFTSLLQAPTPEQLKAIAEGKEPA